MQLLLLCDYILIWLEIIQLFYRCILDNTALQYGSLMYLIASDYSIVLCIIMWLSNRLENILIWLEIIRSNELYQNLTSVVECETINIDINISLTRTGRM